jgi:anti-sigma regulatory factor (Ser/Thr protein kinase)
MEAGLTDVHKSDVFRHEALFYSGERDFVKQTLPFIRESIDSREPILVVVSQRKIELLKEELGNANRHVMFADMTEVGLNPARIIPVWQEFVDESPDGRCRGIGEPVSAERGSEEILESQIHESLLNIAFDGGTPLWLMCPYDMSVLRDEVIDEAYRSHPFIHGGRGHENTNYRALDSSNAFDWPLPKAPAGAVEMISAQAHQTGFSQNKLDDLVLVVNEIATNSLKYGGGGGLLRLWREVDAVVCEVGDAGKIDQPLAGRLRPTGDLEGGMGLWLANQLCDLVQVRSYKTGSVVRVRMSI